MYALFLLFQCLVYIFYQWKNKLFKRLVSCSWTWSGPLPPISPGLKIILGFERWNDSYLGESSQSAACLGEFLFYVPVFQVELVTLVSSCITTVWGIVTLWYRLGPESRLWANTCSVIKIRWLFLHWLPTIHGYIVVSRRLYKANCFIRFF